MLSVSRILRFTRKGWKIYYQARVSFPEALCSLDIKNFETNVIFPPYNSFLLLWREEERRKKVNHRPIKERLRKEWEGCVWRKWLVIFAFSLSKSKGETNELRKTLHHPLKLQFLHLRYFILHCNLPCLKKIIYSEF